MFGSHQTAELGLARKQFLRQEDRNYKIGAQRRKTANGSPPGEQSESINWSGFRKRQNAQHDPMGFAFIHSPSVFFDSVAPAPSPFGPTFGCSSSKVPTFPVAVNPAGFGFS